LHQVSFPLWLHWLAIACLAIASTCAVVIAVDESRRSQHMWIMNLVWPLTALFGSLLWLAAYIRWGRTTDEDETTRRTSFAASVAIGTSHCGAGCTLGDLSAE